LEQRNAGMPTYGLESSDSYRVLWIQSQCQSEIKNQDRASARFEGSTCFATLCDGVTQSMHSVVAAEILSSDPPSIWIDGVLPARIERLRQLRSELLAASSPHLVERASWLERTFADILREQQHRSFQTTCVSARLTTLNDGSVELTVMHCGDSAVLAFDRNGRLLFSRREIADEISPFQHLSPVTEVLPDHEHALTTAQRRFDEPPHVILCSDGFYDAFPHPSALFRWIVLSGEIADASAVEPRFAELHERLGQARGDDDMSFVWIAPLAVVETVEAQPAGTPSAAWKPSPLLVRLRKSLTWLQTRLGRNHLAPIPGKRSTED
jgi:serine/threonine protein phosphatase PrpC